MTDIAAASNLEVTRRVGGETPKVSAESSPNQAIADERFIGQLDQLRQLKQFFFEEKVNFKREDLAAIDLGELNNLVHSAEGRVPSIPEWRLLDEKLSTLAFYLTADLRRKIRIRELGIFFRVLPLVFLSSSILATIAYTAVVYTPAITGIPNLYSFLFLVTAITWLVSQGGLGACGFLGTSAITKGFQDIGTAEISKNREIVDVTDRNFLVVRILLGTLFATLIGLPFVSRSLNSILHGISTGFASSPSTNNPESAVNWPSDLTIKELMFVLLPFIVGFSTNLVLVLLSRCVTAIETFFGLSGRS